MTPTAIRHALVILVALWLAPVRAGAVELADGRLYVNGNGEWSFQATDREGAVYGRGVADGEWETAMFDLLVIAKPTDYLSAYAQAGFDLDTVSLEWAFLEWKLSDALRIRAGKVKQPLGNYTEIRFVGTSRPLYDLPAAVYGPNLIAAQSYSGLGFTGDFHLAEGWTLQYDLWGGGLVLPSYEPYKTLSATSGQVRPPAFEDEHVENLVGLRASITTPSAWTFRASTFGGNVVTDADGRVELWVAGASAWYRGEKLWVSLEGFYSKEVKFERTLAAYAEAAWFVTEKTQVAARYELSRARLSGWPANDPALRHSVWTLGGNYWITPGAVVRASVDYVEGSRFILDEEWVEAGYEDATLAAPLARPPERTFRFLVGTQFTF